MSDVILLLDDDATALSFLEGVLTGAGFTCATVSDAEQALEAVRGRPEIALVISDIYMPGMTGLQFVDRLNSLTLDWLPPAVLLLTAHPTLETAVNALRLGACDFLSKPVRPTELVEVVTRALQRVRLNRAKAGATSPDVDTLIRHAEEIAGALRRLTHSTADARPVPPVHAQAAGDAPAQRSPVEAQPPKGRVSVLNAIEGLRKLRLHYEDHHLDDVAWDLLLELMRTDQKQVRLSVSALTISIPGVSSTTSLRRIGELSARGYIERIPDARDGRRDFVDLTPKSRALLLDYLAHADSCLMDIRAEEQVKPPFPGRSR